MKTIFITILTLTILVLVSGCSMQNDSATELVYMRDITDTIHTAQMQAKEVYPFFDFEKNKWSGCIFRFVNISDVSYNHTYEVRIASENEWLGNEIKRGKEIKNFNAGISKILTDTEKEKTGKNHSSIYDPIARELNWLSQSTSQKKILIVYSDLMENTDNLSFYNNRELYLIKAKPDSISKYFQSQVPLKKLNGITVYLIYNPSDMWDDEKYKIVSDFYKNLLESKGAKVVVGANIIKGDL